MNFMFHTMLDATSIVLRGHFKSMKCDVLFSQGSVHTLFRWGGYFSYMSKKNSSSLQQCKNYKNRSRFPKVMITNVLPPFFMVHSVDGPRTASVCQCKFFIFSAPYDVMSVDEQQLPVIQSSVIVRCRSCRTYINPFVTFVDLRRWKCNLCFRVNEC